MEARYIDHMGSDLSVVNAARVSFHKESTTFSEQDQKLLNYLANHNHWTPFSHTAVTLGIKAPIFVARQAFKHKVGFTENEVSRRYVDEQPEFFLPKEWRGRPTNGAKQGSSDEIIMELAPIYRLSGEIAEPAVPVTEAVLDFYAEAEALYDRMIVSGIAPEQARMVLPQAMYTEWWWTSSLVGWARFYNLRMDPHAQKEIRDLAADIGPLVGQHFPISWEALTNGK